MELGDSFKGKDLIIGCSWCGFTQAAVKLLPGAKKVMLDECDTHGDLRRRLEKKYKHKTVPFVFIKGEFIGGYTQLANLQK